MIELETIETERLLLKALTPETFKRLFENFSEQEVIEFLGLRNHAEYIEQKSKSDGGYQTYDKTILAFLMVVKESGEPIGRCGYHNWYPNHSRAEIGYALSDDKHKRKGYMREALEAIIPYGFNQMKLNRIEAFVGAENQGSLRLMDTFHFTKEGHFREHYVRNNIAEDSLAFSLLQSEFETR